MSEYQIWSFSRCPRRQKRKIRRMRRCRCWTIRGRRPGEARARQRVRRQVRMQSYTAYWDDKKSDQNLEIAISHHSAKSSFFTMSLQLLSKWIVTGLWLNWVHSSRFPQFRSLFGTWTELSSYFSEISGNWYLLRTEVPALQLTFWNLNWTEFHF